MKFSKVILGLTIALVFSNSSVASDPVTLDTLIKVEGKIILVDVANVTSTYVNYYVPGSDERYTMNRKEVHKILYASGRKEDYNPIVLTVLDSESWKAVWLTDKKKDVAHMYKRGKLKVHAKPSTRSAEAAKSNATILAQKRAAAMKGQYIHVTKRLKTGGYGNLNGYLIEGIAYGEEPLEEEANGEIK